MKTKALFGILTLLAGSLMAQDNNQTDVSNAAQALASQPSYSWTQTVVVPPDSQFQPAPIDGKIANGVISVSTSFRDNAVKYVIKGTNAVVYSEDNGWQSLDEMTNRGARFMVGMIRNFMTPAMQATNVLASAQTLTKVAGACSADLTDDGAKAMLTFRRGGQASVSNAKGSVQFWINGGVLSKYEIKVSGTVTFNDNDIQVDRDTTVVISGVGSTTVDVPDDAQKKLP